MKSPQPLVGMMVILLASLVAGSSLMAANSVAIPIRHPGQPRLLKLNLTEGNVQVLGYDGTNIVLTASSAAGPNAKTGPSPDSDGLDVTPKSTPFVWRGFNIIEHDAEIAITAGLPSRAGDLTIRVPRSTAIRFTGANGSLVVEQLNGDIEAKSLNGEIQLKQVSGSIALHSLNGKIQVVFSQVPLDKAVAVSTLTGDIEVTFPANLKANVKLKTNNGYLESDFEVRPEVRARPKPVDKSQLPEGIYPPFIGRTLVGTINGGGPDFQFITHNGNIRIRQGAK
jgi:hypothetical protein